MLREWRLPKLIKKRKKGEMFSVQWEDERICQKYKVGTGKLPVPWSEEHEKEVDEFLPDFDKNYLIC